MPATSVIKPLPAPADARPLDQAEFERFEGYLSEIFTALGMDVETDGTRQTPRRFLQAMVDATAGYDGDPKLRTVFPSEHEQGRGEGSHQIVEGPIAFYALCEHHALPFHGRAYIGYFAGEQIIGISKLTRLVRLYARRFTVQERLVEQIADGLLDLVDARGVAVFLEATHLCTQMRGVAEDTSRTRTVSWRGLYERDSNRRHEFLELTAL